MARIFPGYQLMSSPSCEFNSRIWALHKKRLMCVFVRTHSLAKFWQASKWFLAHCRVYTWHCRLCPWHRRLNTWHCRLHTCHCQVPLGTLGTTTQGIYCQVYTRRIVKFIAGSVKCTVGSEQETNWRDPSGLQVSSARYPISMTLIFPLKYLISWP